MQQTCKLLLHVEQHLQSARTHYEYECAGINLLPWHQTSSVCTERKLSQQYCLTAPQPVRLCLSQPYDNVGGGGWGGKGRGE